MYKTVNIGIFTTIESWDFKNKRPKKRINFFFSWKINYLWEKNNL